MLKNNLYKLLYKLKVVHGFKKVAWSCHFKFTFTFLQIVLSPLWRLCLRENSCFRITGGRRSAFATWKVEMVTRPMWTARMTIWARLEVEKLVAQTRKVEWIQIWMASPQTWGCLVPTLASLLQVFNSYFWSPLKIRKPKWSNWVHSFCLGMSLQSPGMSLPSPALTSPSGILPSPASLASPAVSLPSLQSPMTPSMSDERPVSSSANFTTTTASSSTSSNSVTTQNNGSLNSPHSSSNPSPSSSLKFSNHHHISNNHHSHHAGPSPNLGFGLGHLFSTSAAAAAAAANLNIPFPFPMGLKDAFPRRNPVGANPHDINNPLSVNQLTGQCNSSSSSSSSASSLSSGRSSSSSLGDNISSHRSTNHYHHHSSNSRAGGSGGSSSISSSSRDRERGERGARDTNDNPISNSSKSSESNNPPAPAHPVIGVSWSVIDLSVKHRR